MPEPAVFQRIPVAVGDGSCADQLVTGVAGLASTGDAEVLLVHVSDCNVCCGAMDHPALNEHEHELLRSLIERLAACGVRARGEARVTTNGRPGRLRGRPWRRVLARLLDDGACSVLVLPRQQSAVAGRETSRWWRSTRWPSGQCCHVRPAPAVNLRR